MKLLTVISSYYPAFQCGGPISSVHALNKALVKKGIDVSVYTTNVALETQVCVNKETIVEGVKVTYFAFNRSLEFLGTTGWQFSLTMAKRLKRNLKDFDLVYVIGVWNHSVAVTCHYCRKYKIPYIISPRGLLYPYATGKKPWKKWPYYYFIARKDLTCANAIHYTSDNEAESCHQLLGLRNKTIVIPNGLDLSEFADLPQAQVFRRHYPDLQDKRIILFLGRISWKKGLDILIEVFNKIAKERSDTHLVIAGVDEGGYIKSVKKWVGKYGLENRVTFTGMLLGREKLAAFVDSNLFVLPSYSENFGMSVIEAMACGLPVVISNQVGVYKDIQKNNGAVVVECNAASLYQGITAILDNPDLAARLTLQARKITADYFDIEKVADRMLEAFGECLLNFPFP